MLFSIDSGALKKKRRHRIVSSTKITQNCAKARHVRRPLRRNGGTGRAHVCGTGFAKDVVVVPTFASAMSTVPSLMRIHNSTQTVFAILGARRIVVGVLSPLGVHRTQTHGVTRVAKNGVPALAAADVTVRPR